MKRILVTGAGGQLGKCLKSAAKNYKHLDFVFKEQKELDINFPEQIEKAFAEYMPDYCINCAAYTNVEKAESEKKEAFDSNEKAVEYLSDACQQHQTTLIHISTDYVFDGESTKAYTETDIPNPINVYGASKLAGERIVQQKLEAYYIFRTSWLYSEFGHNFFNTMLQKAEEKDVVLKITTEQKGTPTNANDLASAILKTIDAGAKKYGLYHFSNGGEATWYSFAKAIFTNAQKLEAVDLIASDAYKTKAKRPVNSLLSKEKVQTELGVEIIDWQESLKKLQQKIA